MVKRGEKCDGGRGTVTGRSHVDGFHVHVSCFMRIKCILIVAFEGVKTENELKRETEREAEGDSASNAAFSHAWPKQIT